MTENQHNSKSESDWITVQILTLYRRLTPEQKEGFADLVRLMSEGVPSTEIEVKDME